MVLVGIGAFGARAADRIVIGGDRAYPPYEYMEEDGTPVGFCVDISRAVARAAGLDMEFRLDHWAIVRASLRTGGVDAIMAMVKSRERERDFDFSTPYHLLTYTLFTKTDRDIASLEDVGSGSVAVLNEGMAHDYLRNFRPRSVVTTRSTVREVLEAVAEGEAEAALVPRIQGEMLIREHGLEKIRSVGPPVIQQAYSFAVRKGNARLLWLLDEGLASVKASGEYDRIYRQWFQIYERPELSFEEAVRHVLLVAVPLVCLVFLFMVWNWSLRREVERRTRELSEANRELSGEILERRRAEQQLGEETERLAVTLRSIGDGVITSDVDGRVVLLNTVAERLTGWSQKAAAGQPMTDVFRIINEKTRKVCENPVEKVLATGNVVMLANHTALIAQDGTERSIADSGAPIQDGEGRIIGVVLVFRDVTDENRMEEELLKVRKLESLGVLAGGIAHDFNNILMALLGNVSLARSLCTDRPGLTDLLLGMERAALRARDLTQQLLTFSRGGDPVTQAASIEDVVRESAGFVLRGSRVRCDIRFEENLWDVEIDAGQISQVIQNLILNAEQAMPKGGVIRIAGENLPLTPEDAGRLPLKEENYVRVTVEDEGCGIARTDLDRVFDPFFTTRTTGTGLGLATTHSIVRKHNGHIRVESEMGKGATFILYLPVSEGIRAETVTEGQVAATPVARRVLVMDDDEIVRLVVERLLRNMGFDVVLANDGYEAVAAYGEAHGTSEAIDLVITDLTVAGSMGGLEAMEEILRIDPDARGIVSSGYSNDPIMANHLDHGFRAAMVKPYTHAELMGRISEVLGEDRLSGSQPTGIDAPSSTASDP